MLRDSEINELLISDATFDVGFVIPPIFLDGPLFNDVNEERHLSVFTYLLMQSCTASLGTQGVEYHSPGFLRLFEPGGL